MSKFKSFALIPAVVFLVGMNACQKKSEGNAGGNPAGAMSKKAGGPASAPPTKVAGLVLRSQAFSAPLSVNGSLLANQEVEVRSEISGRVERIDFSEGKAVRAGQVMVQIDDAEVKANFQRAQARLKLAVAQEARIKQQLDAGAASAKDFDQASAERSQAEADAALLKAQLAKTQIKSPFAGVAGLLPLYRGAFVQPGTRITTVQDLSRFKLEFSVPEQESWRVRQGLTVQFLATGRADTLAAEIYAMEPRLDETTRALTVRAFVKTPKRGLDLIPGAFSEVILGGGAGDSALVIPPSAISMAGAGAMVFLAQGGKAVPHPVRLGGRLPEAVQILSGVKAGDTVIVSGFMTLRPNATVAVSQVN